MRKRCGIVFLLLIMTICLSVLVTGCTINVDVFGGISGGSGSLSYKGSNSDIETSNSEKASNSQRKSLPSYGSGSRHYSSYPMSNTPLKSSSSYSGSYYPEYKEIWVEFSNAAKSAGHGNPMNGNEGIFTFLNCTATTSNSRTVKEGTKNGTKFFGGIQLAKNGSAIDKCITFTAPEGAITIEIYASTTSSNVTVGSLYLESASVETFQVPVSKLIAATTTITAGQNYAIYVGAEGSMNIWGILIKCENAAPNSSYYRPTSSSYDYPSSSMGAPTSQDYPTYKEIWVDFSAAANAAGHGNPMNGQEDIFTYVNGKAVTSMGKTVKEGSKFGTKFTGAVKLMKEGSPIDKCITFTAPEGATTIEIYTSHGVAGVPEGVLYLEGTSVETLYVPDVNVSVTTATITAGQNYAIYAGTGGTMNIWGILIKCQNVESNSSYDRPTSSTRPSTSSSYDYLSSSTEPSTSQSYPTFEGIWMDFSYAANAAGKDTVMNGQEGIFTYVNGEAHVSSGKTVKEGIMIQTRFTGAVQLGKNGSALDKCITFTAPEGATTIEIYVSCGLSGVTAGSLYLEGASVQTFLAPNANIIAATATITAGQSYALYAGAEGSMNIWGILIR